MNAARPSRALGCLFAVGLGFTACDGCRRDHPFTPFVVGSTSPSSTVALPSASAAGVQSAAPVPANNDGFPTEGERVPAETHQVRVGARQIEAPKGTVFETVLRGDWQADGATDALVLLRSTVPDSPTIGSVYLFGGTGDAKKLADLPGWLPSRADCSWEPRLSRVGKDSVSVDVRVKCAAAMPARTPTRYLAFLEPTRGEPVVASWRLADAAPDERFEATLNGTDIDGDGRDDVSLSLSLTHIPTNREARGEFAWLDRAAGVSREPGHFANSLGPMLASLDKQAANRKTAPEALERAGAVWRLLASACAESASARLLRSDGTPLSCENLANPLGRLVSSEVRAALAEADVLRAAFAITRAESMLGTRPLMADRNSWMKQLQKSVSTIDKIAVTTSEVKPVVSRLSVHFSPLQFQSDGTLLAQTARGVARVEPNGQELAPEDASAPAASWPLSVGSTDRTLENILAACDRSELLVIFKGADGRYLAPNPTPFLAPRPGVCAGAAAVNWRVSPIAAPDEGLPTALVEGACISASSTDACLKPSALGKFVPGSPRSPDGRRLIAQAGFGLLSIGGPKPELWMSDKLAPASSLSECVIDNSGNNVACVRAGRITLLARITETGLAQP